MTRSSPFGSDPLSGEEASRASTPESRVDLRETVLRRHLSGASRGLVLLDNVERDLPLDRLVEVLLGVNLTALVTSRYLPTSQRLEVLRLDVLAPDPARTLFRDRFTERGGAVAGGARRGGDAGGGAWTGLPAPSHRARSSTGGHTRAAASRSGAGAAGAGRAGQTRNASDPTASVRYSLERSLASVPEGDRPPFAALSLLRGPDAPRMVAEAVLGSVGEEGADAGAMLDRLAAFSLVEVFALPLDRGAAYRQRVRLHPLVRELAEEHWQRLPSAFRRRASRRCWRH